MHANAVSCCVQFSSHPFIWRPQENCVFKHPLPSRPFWPASPQSSVNGTRGIRCIVEQPAGITFVSMLTKYLIFVDLIWKWWIHVLNSYESIKKELKPKFNSKLQTLISKLSPELKIWSKTIGLLPFCTPSRRPLRPETHPRPQPNWPDPSLRASRPYQMNKTSLANCSLWY